MTVKYTRELLAGLAAQSVSVNDMMRRLGVPLAGGTHSYLSRRLKHYGIDISHFNADRPLHERQAYSKERLADAARRSDSLGSMLRHLGVTPYDGAYSYLKKRLDQFGIDTSHWTGRTRAGRFAGLVPEDVLRAAVREQRSLAGLLRALSLPENSSSRNLVKRSLGHHRIDTSHFTGQAHARGKRSGPRRRPHEVLVERPPGSHRVPGERLRAMLLHIGRPDMCAMCGGPPNWLGHPLTLEVDHINGNWLDNRADNLRLLCPNCHSVTPTYCGRNRKRADAR